jgi:hypothetical protein
VARAPFPWDRLADIDEMAPDGDSKFLNDLRMLIEIRRRSPALQYGSMRWVDATEHSVTDVRESGTRSMLVHLVRQPCASRRFAPAGIGLIVDPGADDRTAVEFGQGNLVEVHLGAGTEPSTIVLPGTPGAYLVSCARR